MFPVSTAYKEAIQLHRKQGFRNTFKARIYLGAFDPTAMGDVALSDNGHTAQSTLANINAEAVYTSYATWENNSFSLDGSQRFMPRKSHDPQGYISDVLSGADGVFTKPPTITIAHEDKHELAGLTLNFDSTSGAYAREITISTYLFGEHVETKTIQNDIAACEIDERFSPYDTMILSFDATRHAGQRVHLNNILFGMGYLYEDDDIVSIDHVREISPVSLELPNNTLKFTLLNRDGVFNVDEQSSLLNFLREDQEVRVSYGYDVSGNGDIEWVTGGTYWMSTWETVGQQSTFTAIDIFSRMSATTYRTSVYNAAATAAERVNEVVADAGIGSANVNDTRMQSEILIQNPLPESTHAAELQLIANAARTTLENGVDGSILFRARELTKIDTATPTTVVTAFSGSVLEETEKTTYATWEQDFFALDGGQQLLPDNGYKASGLVMDIFPTDGEYENASVRLTFDGTATIGSILLTFNEYAAPDTIQIRTYRAGTLLWKKTYQAGQSELEIAGDFDRVDAIDVCFVQSAKYRRPRLELVSASWDSGFELTDDDTLGNPTGRILVACRNVDAEVFDYEIEAEAEEISETKVAVGDWVTIDHGAPYDGVTATTSAGTLAYKAYAYCTDVCVTDTEEAEVTVTLSGYKLNQKSTIHVIEPISESGENCAIYNPLLTGDVARTEYMAWIRSYLESRIEWEVPTLGYPEVQPADSIVYRGERAYVKANKLSYNGALRGTLVLRKKEGG